MLLIFAIMCEPIVLRNITLCFWPLMLSTTRGEIVEFIRNLSVFTVFLGREPLTILSIYLNVQEVDLGLRNSKPLNGFASFVVFSYIRKFIHKFIALMKFKKLFRQSEKRKYWKLGCIPLLMTVNHQNSGCALVAKQRMSRSGVVKNL